MTDDSGIMSIDFLVGFTIFMITFIWVATMVPGLFIGIQSHAIDFDAVAYRTGVILAEDPGTSAWGLCALGNCSSWEYQPDADDVARFGLAISKDTPNILDEKKVNRFFCLSTTDPSTTVPVGFIYPKDYQKKVIFGDYPYRFNISLRTTGEDNIRSVGEIIPSNYNYGYIRRDVKIKGSSNTTIGAALIKAHRYNNTEEMEFNQFRIVINSSDLISGNIGEHLIDPNGDIAYRINPIGERIIINITDFEETRNTLNFPFPPTHIWLSSIKIYQGSSTDSNLYNMGNLERKNFTYEDGNTTPVHPPIEFKNNLSMVFEPGFFKDTDRYGQIYINMTFEIDPHQQFLNNTHTRPFYYNYNPVNVTQPALRDAVMEVAVW